jgi:hypothetical protein
MTGLPWLLCGLLTTLLWLVGWVAGTRIAPTAHWSEQALTGGLVTTALQLLAMRLLSGGALYARPLTAVALSLAVGVAVACVRAPGPELRDLRPWPRSSIDLVPLLAIGALLVFLAAQIWLFRSWAWDSIWYHVGISALSVQEARADWFNSPIPYIAGYPNHGELLAAWPGILTRDNRLDDSGQLAFGVLGALLVKAWSLRAGATGSTSTWFACSFPFLTPVLLQLTSNANDVMCGVLLASSVFYLTAPGARPSDRGMAWVSLALYVGTKYTGLFHAVLLLPIIIIKVVWEVREAVRPTRRILAMTVVGGFLLVFGLYKHGHNFVQTGNPVFPMHVTLPGGWVLEGPDDPAEMGYGGLDDPFLSGPRSLERMLEYWWVETPGRTGYEPNIHQGGFGPIWRWLAVPALLLQALLALRWPRRERLAVLCLFLLAIMAPSAWWPRFIIGAAIAGLVAVAMSAKGRLAVPVVLTAALLTGEEFRHAVDGFLPLRESTFRDALAMSPLERARQPLGCCLMPAEHARLRDEFLEGGGIFAYDDSVFFFADLFSPTYAGRVVYVPQGDGEYVSNLRSLGARMAAVASQSRGARSLRAQGVEPLFTLNDGRTTVFRLP